MTQKETSMRQLIETVELALQDAQSAPQTATPPTAQTTDPTRMGVSGGQGTLNPTRIAKELGWQTQNASQFAAAMNKLKNAEPGQTMRDVINSRQAWVMADALWKLMTSDTAQKRRLMNLLVSFRQKE